MVRQREQGSGALLMVMLLGAVGLLMASGVQRQLDAATLTASDERRYVQHLNQAESALNWGLGQVWTMDDDSTGQCQRLPDGALRACLVRVPGKTYWLLRAEGRSVTQSATLRLYQRVVLEPPSGRITPLSGGWLDFCPEKEEAYCAEP